MVGTGSGGSVDYIDGEYTVMIPAGTTTLPLTILIIVDDMLEGNEYFMLTINSSSLPTDVTVGSPDQAIVTIVDGDGKYLDSNSLKFH